MIAELHKTYPNGIYLDIGSMLDLICTKRTSRDKSDSYEEVYNIYNEAGLISKNWNDSEYEYIYKEAQLKLGLHVGN